ncbi:MAG: hypothetical protein NXI16_08840 [Alphaproteobacteria bacterium]|nr:hypothetical protein [Alphaproteobacteria bacterium]
MSKVGTMFGAAKGQNGKNPEAEAAKIEAQKRSFTEGVANLEPFAQEGNFEKCETVIKKLMESLKKSKLPGDFMKQTQQQADHMLRDAYMMATDKAIHAALKAGRGDDREGLTKALKDASAAIAGAMKYKASPKFKEACTAALEIAKLSGGIKQEGPTKAKPLDTAPKPKNLAKPDEDYYRALAEAESEADAPRSEGDEPKGGGARKGKTSDALLDFTHD